MEFVDILSSLRNTLVRGRWSRSVKSLLKAEYMVQSKSIRTEINFDLIIASLSTCFS